MSSNEAKLKILSNREGFGDIIKKLTLDQDLTFEESSFILGCAIIFLNAYSKDKRHTTYADIAYYIILKYSLLKEDYQPLYDFSVNFGFFPIAAYLNKIGAIESNVETITLQNQIDKFSNQAQGYIETLEQYNSSEKFLEDESIEKAYIAPTSFGKSSLIIQYIRKLKDTDKKIAIILPKKSLLLQTYKTVRESKLNRKILLHNEMYDGEEKFIAVFTQERALRFLKNKNISFDVLIIDEAHNLMEKDPRQILLSRLIKRNKNLKPLSKIIYLSPLIEDVKNLRVLKEQNIIPYHIKFNIKEPEFYEFNMITGKIYKYSRFADKFYEIGKENNKLQYIISQSKSKNYIFEYRPINIELLAKELATEPYLKKNNLGKDVEIIKQIQNTLSINIHEDFNIIDLLDYGLIYLHGQLPNLIKEYLEHQFKVVENIKYLVANTVILEGINLPIDTLFVSSDRNVSIKSLQNLVGRVNRLSEIFNGDNVDLYKLLPQVHFFCKLGEPDKHNNKLKLFRSRFLEDEVSNPTLLSYDLRKDSKGKSENYTHDIQLLQHNEKFLDTPKSTIHDNIIVYFIESGFSEYYISLETAVKDFSNFKEKIDFNKWEEYNMMEKINYAFLSNISNVKDYKFKRLENEESRKYYEYHILISLKETIKKNIISQYNYFKKKKDSDDPKLYMGEGFGEEPYVSSAYPDSRQDVYVNLKEKTPKQLINLAIIKLKMEEDFITFTISKFIDALFDFNLINEEEYNKYIYGTTDKNKIIFTKTGLSISLITRLENDKQLSNVSLDDNNNLIGNKEFYTYLETVDDLYKFELSRYLFKD